MAACLAYIETSVISVGSAYNITLQVMIVQLLTIVNNEVRTLPFINPYRTNVENRMSS